MTDALGNTTQYEWNPLFPTKLAVRTDPGGRVWQYLYDGHGELIEEPRSAGRTAQRPGSHPGAGVFLLPEAGWRVVGRRRIDRTGREVMDEYGEAGQLLRA